MVQLLLDEFVQIQQRRWLQIRWIKDSNNGDEKPVEVIKEDSKGLDLDEITVEAWVMLAMEIKKTMKYMRS